MIIGVPKESIDGENRVAVIPESVKKLVSNRFEIFVEKGAGVNAGYLDSEYEEAGAKLVGSFADMAKADIITKVHHISGNEGSVLKDNAVVFSFQDALNQKDNIELFNKKNVTAFAMEFIPRITLAQSMDVLSSMATVAGYKAVLLATEEFGKFLPMLMTAAGTIPPAKVLILGAGVAGLQAIATARRLGAVVEAFDTRPMVKEQVMSLGAKFIEIDFAEDAQDDQGYAKELSEEFYKKEMELIDKHLSKSDICITTALVFGKQAPTLIHDYMVENMKPGSVIVDLAVEKGGNCTVSRPGKVVNHKGVKVIGPVNLTSSMPDHASRMYSKNIENLLVYLNDKENQGNIVLNTEDEIVNRSLVTHKGEMVSEIVKSFS